MFGANWYNSRRADILAAVPGPCKFPQPKRAGEIVGRCIAHACPFLGYSHFEAFMATLRVGKFDWGRAPIVREMVSAQARYSHPTRHQFSSHHYSKVCPHALQHCNYRVSLSHFNPTCNNYQDQVQWKAPLKAGTVNAPIQPSQRLEAV